mgnify:CR=1 FL=1
MVSGVSSLTGCARVVTLKSNDLSPTVNDDITVLLYSLGAYSLTVTLSLFLTTPSAKLKSELFMLYSPFVTDIPTLVLMPWISTVFEYIHLVTSASLTYSQIKESGVTSGTGFIVGSVVGAPSLVVTLNSE